MLCVTGHNMLIAFCSQICNEIHFEVGSPCEIVACQTPSMTSTSSTCVMVSIAKSQRSRDDEASADGLAWGILWMKGDEGAAVNHSKPKLSMVNTINTGIPCILFPVTNPIKTKMDQHNQVGLARLDLTLVWKPRVGYIIEVKRFAKAEA